MNFTAHKCTRYGPLDVTVQLTACISITTPTTVGYLCRPQLTLLQILVGSGRKTTVICKPAYISYKFGSHLEKLVASICISNGNIFLAHAFEMK
jgi:hypothetical protein